MYFCFLCVCLCVCLCLCFLVCVCVCLPFSTVGDVLSTVGDVFSDLEFAAPGNSLLWGLGGLDDTSRECTGFFTMLERPYEWRIDVHGCNKYDNAELGFGLRDQTAHLLVFLHLRTTNLPGPDSIMRSEQAQQRRLARAQTQQT